MSTKELLDQLEKLGVKAPAGWSALDPASPDHVAAKADNARARYERALEVAAPFMTPAGQLCLSHLRAQTVESPTWKVDELGLVNAIGFGILREGQNTLIRYIERQIEIAQQGPTGEAPVKRKR